MRRIRPLLLVAIFIILAGVGVLYRVQRGVEQRRAPIIPKSLPLDTSAAAGDWTWSKEVGDHTVVKMHAKRFKEAGSRFYLEGVELEVRGKSGATLDRFKTARAEFDKDRSVLYSDGEVEITMGEPAVGQTPGRLVFIRTSGLTFDWKSQEATTDRVATFRFDQGEGRATGVLYNPETRVLDMRSEAEVSWHGRRPGSQPMKIEGGEIQYKELDSVILLNPWSRMTRGSLVVEGGRGIVMLQDGVIRRVEGVGVRGVDGPRDGRRLEYAAESLFISLSANGEVEKIEGLGSARAVSLDATARTTVTGERLELAFGTSSGQSQLRTALARDHGRVECIPLASGGAQRAETRLLSSDFIELEMRPGGREISSVETRAPGVIEFLPNSPGQKKRRLEGERISIAYGSQNRIRSLTATNVSTRTEYPPPAGRPARPVMLTWSRELKAEFDPAESELTQLEQWGDFRYEQGDRRGRSERASLDVRRDRITLRERARLWDPSGSLAADRILTDQGIGDVTAEGNVNSTREPERNRQPTAMLSESEPFHAKAARMYAAGGRRLIRYEGAVVLWQGGNRIAADWVEIDRDEQSLVARGNVNSQFVEAPASGGNKRSPVFTLVRAPELAYSDKTRTANYRGGVVMNRSGVEVRASQLRGVFTVKDGVSQLETAYADGQVQISQPAPDRTQTAAAEHAEYSVAQAKVVLNGGTPEFIDSLRGYTRGRELTWFVDNDTLLVDGREGPPAVSRIRRNP